MYAKRGGSRGGARGGFRSAGASKKTFNKKRSSPEDDEPAPASKKAKGDAEDEPLTPKLDTDDDRNPFIAVSVDIGFRVCRGRSTTLTIDS